MQLSKNYKRKLLFYLLVSSLIVFLDQLLKTMILADVGLGKSTSFIPGIIQFFVVQNTGGAFSLFKQFPFFFQVIGIVNVILFSYLVFCPTISFNNFIKTGCTLILGGTVSNLTDRFLRGGVIDYLDLQFVSFAVFNLADVFIDLGVMLILIGWYLNKKL